MFFQLSGEHVVFENLRKDNRKSRYLTTYRTHGVQVFKLNTPDISTIPRPHRFAVKPPPTHAGPCNPLTPGKWYVHVYQTKIETSPSVYTSLPSKLMAKQLMKICGSNYLPRDFDLKDQRPIRIPKKAPKEQQYAVSKSFQTLSAYPPGFQPQPVPVFNPDLRYHFNYMPSNLSNQHSTMNTTWQPYSQNPEHWQSAEAPMSNRIPFGNAHAETAVRAYDGTNERST